MSTDKKKSDLINVPKWIEDNKKDFQPPVCNKMMHGDGQLKVFFVGGPNTRKDFHLEEGEEFFYQISGDMNLICQVNGKFQDVIIKEGEVFLLPGKIPHSPQRFKDTVGLVIERERNKEEFDCLRYFVGDTSEILYEKWFYCYDLGSQLGPVIKEYFASEQHKTGKPIPGTITENPPWIPDVQRKIEKPFSLSKWLEMNANEIMKNGSKRLFDESYQSDIIVYGYSDVKKTVQRNDAQIWFYQLTGSSTLTLEGKEMKLNTKDSYLVEKGTLSEITPTTKESFVLQVILDPNMKSRGFKHLIQK